MNYYPPKPDRAANSPGLGWVTRVMAQDRSRQLTVMSGRASPQINQADYERTKREVTGETDLDLQDALIDAIPESGRWDPVAGATGHQTPGDFCDYLAIVIA